MNDKIEIKNLRFRAIIGVHEWERQTPQPLEADIIVYTDLSLACGSDDLEDTLHYGTLSREILDQAAASSFFLLERLARQIADICLYHKEVEGVTVHLRKPRAVAEADSAGVTIHRDR